VWFPATDSVRYVISAIHVISDRPVKGKVKTVLEFVSEGKRPFRDSFINEIKGKNDFFLFYESAVGWDTTTLRGTLTVGKESASFTSGLKGYGRLKTSSLILAYRISKNDPSALFKRGDTYIRPCFTCIFYGYMNLYLEVLSDSPFVMTGVIRRDGKPVMRIPAETYTSSRNISLTLPIRELKEGDYEIDVSVISPKLGEEVVLKRSFMVSKYGDDIASFIDYIATDEELRTFRRLVDIRERINFLRRFWSKRGDAFYMEFRRRVRVADSLFSTPNRLGRYTDMGRIYIKRGKPDEVVRVDMSEGSRPYVKWVYYTGGGYTYYFYDPIGTGEYVLVRTDDPEEATLGPKYVAPSLDFDEGGGWDR